MSNERPFRIAGESSASRPRATGGETMTTNRKRPRCIIAATVFTLLWSLGDVAHGTNDDQRQEITRLAELTQWKEGTIVADVGAGDGTYSFVAAQKVGPSGRVYATEIDTDKLKNLRAE